MSGDRKLPGANVKLTNWGNEVYPPSDDSFALVDAVDAYLRSLRPSKHLCLEVGCGSGYVITSVVLMLEYLGCQAHGVVTDISPDAAFSTKTTLINHGINAVDVIVADLLSGLSERMAGCVDLVLFNPPYVPTPHDEIMRDGVAKAWAGGIRGREVIDRFLPGVSKLLSPGGRLFMVTVSENDPQGLIQEAAGFGLAGEVVLERKADEELLHIIKMWGS